MTENEVRLGGGPDEDGKKEYEEDVARLRREERALRRYFRARTATGRDSPRLRRKLGLGRTPDSGDDAMTIAPPTGEKP